MIVNCTFDPAFSIDGGEGPNIRMTFLSATFRRFLSAAVRNPEASHTRCIHSLKIQYIFHSLFNSTKIHLPFEIRKSKI